MSKPKYDYRRKKGPAGHSQSRVACAPVQDNSGLKPRNRTPISPPSAQIEFRLSTNPGRTMLSTALLVRAEEGTEYKKRLGPGWGAGRAVQLLLFQVSGVGSHPTATEPQTADLLARANVCPTSTRCLPERGRGPAIRLHHWLRPADQGRELFLAFGDLVHLSCAGEMELDFTLGVPSRPMAV